MAFVTRLSMDVVGLKDLGCIRSRPHFVLDRCRNYLSFPNAFNTFRYRRVCWKYELMIVREESLI
jgi:hypothetical protein